MRVVSEKDRYTSKHGAFQEIIGFRKDTSGGDASIHLLLHIPFFHESHCASSAKITVIRAKYSYICIQDFM